MVTMVTESRIQILAGSCHSFPQYRIHILRLIQYLKIYIRIAHVAIYGKIWLSRLTNLSVAEKEFLVGKLRDPSFKEMKWQRKKKEKFLLFQRNFCSLEWPLNKKECKTRSRHKAYKNDNDYDEITILTVLMMYLHTQWQSSH